VVALSKGGTVHRGDCLRPRSPHRTKCLLCNVCPGT
jgi:hypothetical protein